MELTLSSGLFEVNQKVDSSWFTANINVSKLDLSLSNIESIESNAFTHASFQTLKYLTLNFYPQKATVPSGIFKGLHALERLEFPNMYLRGFGAGVLDDVATTLKYLLLDGPRSNNAIRIDELFTGKNLTQLETVIISHNLESLNARSFQSLTAVKELELSKCQIKEIGSGTFDKINLEVETINLDENLLTTIPSGLVDRFLPLKKLKIPITRNRWNCDCDLVYFKNVLNLDYKLFMGDEIQCKTPAQLNWRSVAETDFCFDPDPTPSPGPITDPDPSQGPNSTPSPHPTSDPNLTTPHRDPPTSPTPTKYPTSTTLTTTTPASEYIKQECHANFDQGYETQYVELKPNNLKMLVEVLQNKTVLIELERVPMDMVLVWFDSEERDIFKSKLIKNPIDNMKCIQPIDTEIFLDDLSPGSTYTVCLIDKHTSRMSPFDCVSFAIPDLDKFMWISLAYKDLCIGLIAMGIILSMILGAIIGVLVVRGNPAWMRDHKRIVVMENTAQRQSEIFVMPFGWDKNLTDWKNR